MRATAVVAHPDDCVIFAKPFMENHPEFDWDIVYLTYQDTDPRAQEVSGYWNRQGVSTKFLGFLDDYRDQESQKLNFWYGIDADTALKSAAANADLILTHNEDGDYGHIHHKLVHDAMQGLEKPCVYFASTFNYNTRCEAKTPLDTTVLPLHADVVNDFDTSHALYIVTDAAKNLIER